MIHYTERLDGAIKTAAWAHEQAGQHRKGTDIPYIAHPFGTMLIASSATTDEDVLIGCLFHDILEDVDSSIYSRETMEKDYGSKVVNIVMGVTKDSTITGWRARSEAYLDHLENTASDESIIVSASDKIHNLTSILSDYAVVGDDLWQRFSTKSKADQQWWYDSILDVITKRSAPDTLVKTLGNLALQLRAIE